MTLARGVVVCFVIGAMIVFAVAMAIMLFRYAKWIARMVKRWQDDLLHAMLQQWGQRNGFRVLTLEPRDFWQGPLPWWNSRDLTVFYLTVEDRLGKTRNGWIRYVDYGLGVGPEIEQVVWENLKDLSSPMHDDAIDGRPLESR